ncbi:MAG: OsmC family peroxiredoxin [Acidobacteriales bacterium]|nr:OsmC family peroxiredoxin [Terriglobales bacterium]
MMRSAVAVWKGSPAIGEGLVTTTSGVMSNVLYSFGSSSGNEPCTSPSEMLAASIASCTSLVLVQELAKDHIHHDSVRTEAELTVNEVKGRWEITNIRLIITAVAPDADEAEFHKASRAARQRCPISRALNVPIEVSTKLETAEHVA